jgi:peroxiredoxin 2/4
VTISLNDTAPAFDLEGIAGGQPRRYRLADFKGRWLVLFFYPSDFTFVCPTEVMGFQKRLSEFKAAGADIAGVSVDPVSSHADWGRELGGLDFPLLSDAGGRVSQAFGVLNTADQRAFRATFIISPEGRIAHLTVSPMNVGRSVDETLRVLRAMQTGRLCPADWKPGEPTLEPELKY